MNHPSHSWWPFFRVTSSGTTKKGLAPSPLWWPTRSNCRLQLDTFHFTKLSKTRFLQVSAQVLAVALCWPFFSLFPFIKGGEGNGREGVVPEVVSWLELRPASAAYTCLMICNFCLNLATICLAWVLQGSACVVRPPPCSAVLSPLAPGSPSLREQLADAAPWQQVTSQSVQTVGCFQPRCRTLPFFSLNFKRHLLLPCPQMLSFYHWRWTSWSGMVCLW